jgi:DNA-binding GntR family transcriptional regulator
MSLFAESERPEVAESRSAALARTIRAAIMDGRLKPGQPLRESDLAKELGTSRTPIREALLLLQAENLVAATPNRGAVLEGYAARLAAEHVTPEILRELEASNERYGELRDSEKLPELVAENLEFHDAILRAAGSARLTTMVRQLTALPMVYQSYMAYSADHRRTAEADHRAITEALRERDGARAAEIMEHHVIWAGERAIAHFKLGASR